MHRRKIVHFITTREHCNLKIHLVFLAVYTILSYLFLKCNWGIYFYTTFFVLPAVVGNVIIWWTKADMIRNNLGDSWFNTCINISLTNEEANLCHFKQICKGKTKLQTWETWLEKLNKKQRSETQTFQTCLFFWSQKYVRFYTPQTHWKGRKGDFMVWLRLARCPSSSPGGEPGLL